MEKVESEVVIDGGENSTPDKRIVRAVGRGIRIVEHW